MWRFILVACASFLLFQACGRNTQPEPSCNFVMNSDQRRVSWNNDVPVTMYIDSLSVPAEYVPAIREAMQIWNAQLQRQVFAEPVYAPVADRHEGDSYSTIYFIHQSWFGTSDEQARTSLFYSGDQIMEADLRVNAQDTLFNLAAHPKPRVNEVDFVSLIVHELGHVLGLAHLDSEHSVMNKQLGYAEDRRDLLEIDKASAHCEY